MSGEVRTRKNRRRQKSRRKKAVVTIENIAPGRAPLGACRPIPSATSPFHHVDNRAVTPSSSEWPRPASKCDSLHVIFWVASLSTNTSTPAHSHQNRQRLSR
ncbi:hypothetical protein RU639_007737 [Aspergillus parasiticus]